MKSIGPSVEGNALISYHGLRAGVSCSRFALLVAAAAANSQRSAHVQIPSRGAFSMIDIKERIAVSFKSQRLMATLGAQLVSVADGEVQISLPFSEHLSQQHGYVHAGAITSVLDSACGYAALTMAPPECEVVTAEFKINFLRPAIGDKFLAIGTVQRSGKLLTVCTGEVRAFAGTLCNVIAIMQATIVNRS